MTWKNIVSALGKRRCESSGWRPGSPAAMKRGGSVQAAHAGCVGHFHAVQIMSARNTASSSS